MELYIEEFHKFFGLPNIIGTIKLSTLGWTEHVVCTKEIRKAFVLKSECKDCL
jgi:hypothetical protein